MQLPSAENRYPTYPGLDAAEYAVFRHVCCPNPHDDRDTLGALDDYLRGAPRGRLDARPKTLAKKVSTSTEVRQGRWIVSCPWCLTPGGSRKHYQFAAKTDHRFFCSDCLNAAAGGRFIAVAWPDEVEAIETLLGKRPEESARNWLPSETVADLAAENLAAGLN